MAKKKSTPRMKGVSFVSKKYRDGSTAILALVRVGKFKPVSKTFKTREEAEAWVKPTIAELEQQGPRDIGPEFTSLTIGQLLHLYLADPEVKALTAYDAYVDWANWWKVNYGTTKVMDFGLRAIHEARGKLVKTRGRLTGRIWSAITVNRHLSLMRGAWNWGREVSGRIPLERVWPQKVMLSEKARIRYLSPDELDAVFTAAEKDRVMKAAILVAISTGIRQGELLGLRWRDISFKRAYLTLLKTKTDTPRRVHIPPTAIEALRALAPEELFSEDMAVERAAGLLPVFLSRDGTRLAKSSLEGRWRVIRTAANLEDFRWHDLRHTCASYLAQNGATLLEIGGVLGHKSPSMTAKYAHLVQGAPVTGHTALDNMLRGK
jgi:integrase